MHIGIALLLSVIDFVQLFKGQRTFSVSSTRIFFSSIFRHCLLDKCLSRLLMERRITLTPINIIVEIFVFDTLTFWAQRGVLFIIASAFFVRRFSTEAGQRRERVKNGNEIWLRRIAMFVFFMIRSGISIKSGERKCAEIIVFFMPSSLQSGANTTTRQSVPSHSLTH